MKKIIHKKSNDSNQKYFIAYYPNDPKYWKIYPNAVDGVLISQKNLHTVKGNPKEILKKMIGDGVRKILELPKNVPLMIDSGAYQYIGEKWEDLPISPEDVLEIYRKLKIDIGVHLDWPITKQLDKKQISKRLQTTIENADITKELLEKSKYDGIEIMAVTQGLTPTMHKKCAQKYIELGYKLIGIGGLAKISGFPLEIKRRIKAVQSVIPKKRKIKIHLFGIGSISTLKIVLNNDIFSFDNATPTMAGVNGDIILSNPYRRFNILKNIPEANEAIPCGCYACQMYGRTLLNRGKRELNLAKSIHNYIHYKNSLTEIMEDNNVRIDRAR